MGPLQQHSVLQAMSSNKVRDTSKPEGATAAAAASTFLTLAKIYSMLCIITLDIVCGAPGEVRE